MDTQFRLFPDAASTAAEQVDRLYFFLVAVATLFTALIFLLIVYFVFKYRRGKPADRSQTNAHRYWILEVIWSLIPLGLTMIMFGWGAELFFRFHQPPLDSIPINVVAKQWMWKIQHADGQQEINSLHIPVGKPVRLRMISEDVIHSFYVPSFRVKQDVLPGRYSTVWFKPTKVGRYRLFCAEYCGTSHSQMTGVVEVLTPTEYANWLQGGPSESPVAAGKKLFDRFRCATCHKDTSDPRAPPLDGIYGRTVQLADGDSLIADDEYLRESIVDPNAKVVAGYQPLMPTYAGQLNEEQILQLIAYLKSFSSVDTSALNSRNNPDPSP